LFLDNPEILQDYHRRFRYLMVDEYQDTNVAQYLWLRLLAQGSRNICCVGDDDQSIYGWRGAEIGNILRFEKDFSGASIIRLECNYRSTPVILAAASSLISHNAKRLGKTLWTNDKGGEPIRLLALWDDREEAGYIADEIESLQQLKKHNLKEIAILVRASFQTRAFEESFINRGLAYKVIGGLRFYERMEIRDAIAYFRIISQPTDDLAFERIINTPKRGIGASSLQAIRQFIKARTLGAHVEIPADMLSFVQESNEKASLSMLEATQEMLIQGVFSGKAKMSLSQLCMKISQWRTMFDTLPIAKAAEAVLKESGYIQMWQQEKTPEAEGRVENLKELIRALEEFESFSEFLEHVSLVTDVEDASNNEMVSIMTLHAAKGLEFDTVFLPGWEEGLFPHQRSLDEKGGGALEEERRLAYVGVTRARKRAYISFAANRRIYNQYQASIPSRFVSELPADCVESVQINNGFNVGRGRALETRITEFSAQKSTSQQSELSSMVQPSASG
jgi:DNA helicase-2/ATP-dependent DNA helicase PcrA